MAAGVPRTRTAVADSFSVFDFLSKPLQEQAQQVAIPERRRQQQGLMPVGGHVVSHQLLSVTDDGMVYGTVEAWQKITRYVAFLAQSAQAMKGERNLIEASNISLRGQVERLAILTPPTGITKTYLKLMFLYDSVMKLQPVPTKALTSSPQPLSIEYVSQDLIERETMQQLAIKCASQWEGLQSHMLVALGQLNHQMLPGWSAIVQQVEGELALAPAVAGLGAKDLSELTRLRGQEAAEEYQDVRKKVIRLKAEDKNLRICRKLLIEGSPELTQLTPERTHQFLEPVLQGTQELEAYVLQQKDHTLVVRARLSEPGLCQQLDSEINRYSTILDDLHSVKIQIQGFLQEVDAG